MFKKYEFKWKDLNGTNQSTSFYVHSKGTRGGFMHRACAIGALPRLDDYDGDFAKYRENDEKLLKSRVAKVSYVNRTWEFYGGQTVLVNLWNKLDKLKFVDMSQISKVNPFKGQEDPNHENLVDPEDLFDGFRRSAARR